jgi:hypothetical protein
MGIQSFHVIPGRHEVASPESITLGWWLWIPCSRKSAPRNDSGQGIRPSP